MTGGLDHATRVERARRYADEARRELIRMLAVRDRVAATIIPDARSVGRRELIDQAQELHVEASREVEAARARHDAADAVLTELTTGRRRACDATPGPVRHPDGHPPPRRIRPMSAPTTYRQRAVAIRDTLTSNRHLPVAMRAGQIEGAIVDLVGLVTELAGEVDDQAAMRDWPQATAADGATP